MTPSESFGKIYRITAKHSGKAISYVPLPGGYLYSEFYAAALSQQGVNGKEEQQFLLFPLDDGSYVIASKDLGKVFDIYNTSQSNKAHCQVFDYHGRDNQRFLLEGARNGDHVIRSKHSGKVLDVRGKSKSDDAIIQQYDYHGGPNQLFRFTEVGRYALPSAPRRGVVGPVPVASSVDDNLPQETTKNVVAETLLPFFVVSESLPRQQAVGQTAYYKVTKERSWRKAFQRRFAGPQQKFTYSVEAGMSKTQSKEMTTKMSFGFEVTGAVFAEKLAPLKATVARETQIVEKTETTESYSMTVEREVEYPGGAALLYAEYQLVDYFTLQRADGVRVQASWEFKNSEEMRQVAYSDLGTTTAKIVVKTKRKKN